MAASPRPLDLVVIGGAGHVGLPLALCFADTGLAVGVYDIDAAKLEALQAGRMPFREAGGEALLRRLLPTGRLEFSTDPGIVSRADVLVVVIGTPIDEFLNPSPRLFERLADDLAAQIRPNGLIVLRSTVFPGTTEFVAERLRRRGVAADVVFCPERIAEGDALAEIRTLPQVIGASSDQAFDRVQRLFERLDVEIVRTTPKEAELIKLFTNAWRYMKFAVANQFFEIADAAGLDYRRILHGIRYHYPRAADLPSPGFAAGPCLLKDTMQLAAFTPDHFPLGHAAMLINEGLPRYIVDRLERERPLAGRTVGILGMAFKGESDDSRSSLSYKLKKLVAFRGARVLCTDPYVRDGDLNPLETVLAESDILILGAPHAAYHGIRPNGQQIVDVWGFWPERTAA